MKDKKNIIIGITIICVIILSTFFIIIKNLESTMIHDGIKREIKFNNITSMHGTVIELEKGKNTLDINIEKGSIHIKLYSERDIIIEEDVKESKKLEVEVSKKGGCVVDITGKQGKGTIKY